ncbi:MAG TPA: Ig-like domain-containing protein [Gemmatimonadaceae bacterium]|jgi:hypothetical protein
MHTTISTRSVARCVFPRAAVALALVAGVACGSSTPTSGLPQAASVTIDPPASTVTTGDSVQLSAVAKDASGTVLTGATFAWSSSDTDAAPVSATGVVGAFLPVTATITAKSGSASNTAMVTVQAAASVALHEGGIIGTVTFPNGNTANGGQGSAVDTIPCGSGTDAEHYHVHMSLIVNGQQMAIPLGIGIMNAFLRGDSLAIAGTCFYWLHSHDRTGIIHVEPAVTGRTFTLGEYFDIWGEPLTTGNVAGNTGPVTVYVNGARYFGDPRAIQLAAHQEITLEVGTRVAPPTYTFPADY